MPCEDIASVFELRAHLRSSLEPSRGQADVWLSVLGGTSSALRLTKTSCSPVLRRGPAQPSLSQRMRVGCPRTPSCKSESVRGFARYRYSQQHEDVLKCLRHTERRLLGVEHPGKMIGGKVLRAALLALLFQCGHGTSVTPVTEKKAYTMHTVFSAECTPYFDVPSRSLSASDA